MPLMLTILPFMPFPLAFMVPALHFPLVPFIFLLMPPFAFPLVMVTLLLPMVPVLIVLFVRRRPIIVSWRRLRYSRA